jgi:hypothetical protein
VVVSAAGLAPGRTIRADLRDVAPTVLRLFDLPIPDHVEGSPLEVLSDHTTTVRQDAGSSVLNGLHRPQFEYTPEEQAIIEQRLADLGYLE